MIRKGRGLTEWDLLLNYDLSYYFSDLPAYRARVAGLKPLR